ncbi:hypothetical protein UlMin_005358 [Ulmus minor]
MVGKQKITQYRERLDKTLVSPNLTNAETLKALVKKQLLRTSGQEIEGCSDTLIEKRTAEVSNFLDMLRSPSGHDNERSKAHPTSLSPEWKLKQDNEEFRVMYREGPQGTPYHSLLVEGYVDGPLDVCLCISWETGFFKKWWPQSTIPTFKIVSSKCLQSVRIGEQISLVRMKVSWPLSTREAVVHFFMFEYFEDDLIVVLLNSISDLDSISRTTHGFTSESIPEEKDVVRIDVVGGFALQKVTAERSYFRTIANMDIKLDFVPPSLINFISRQLIGNGFTLYKKAVASMSTSDQDFIKALTDPLYTWICRSLYSSNESIKSPEGKELEIDASNLIEEHVDESELIELDIDAPNLPEECLDRSELGDVKVTDLEVHCAYHASESPSKDTKVIGSTAVCEIEELKSDESKRFDDQIPTKENIERFHVNDKRNVIISTKVEEALGTLEKVINMVREYGFNPRMQSASDSTNNKESTSLEEEEEEECLSVEVHIEDEKEVIETNSSHESVRNSSVMNNSRHGGSSSLSKEINHNKIAPASPTQELSLLSDTNTNQVALHSTKDPATPETPILNHSLQTKHLQTKHSNSEMNGFHGSSPDGGKKKSKQKKRRFWCFSISKTQ